MPSDHHPLGRCNVQPTESAMLIFCVSEIDTAYYILTVDLWSEDGRTEANLVRHSSTSPSISAATATSYPPEPSAISYAHNVPVLGTHFYPGYEAAQPNYTGVPYPIPRQNELAHHMHQAQKATREEAIRIQQEQQTLQNQGHHHSMPKTGQSQQMHSSTQGYLPNQGGTTATTNGMAYPTQSTMSYHPQGPMLSPNPMIMNVVDPRSHPGGMFTRNLIGNLAVGAFKLTYPENDLGVWFILQDLSVRTEGTFRLKLNFVDVGTSASAAMDPPTPRAQTQSLQTGKLNTAAAPVLASCYSNHFQVFSAKKFPGVVDSTDLSKAFAKQGIKIPIRKDGGGARGNERREWDDGD
ncbi:uncharacterized protein KY384_009017 [Bacidia gigantensis]|uniref:uncharacterized protein n=1 Tax=Bacidia gigantensis TaxID=2732470 RepID=UPI001D038445|nr:uncharacterized protein KY384_009017 [Bacidia gigantensis]KAG8525373.1 hypothetical protein KY384_009017 [Bacidia gigantensis]